VTLGALLIITRWVHLFAISLLFGAALFPFYNGDRTAVAGNRVLRGLSRLLIWSAALALASGILWFALAETSGPINFRLLWLGRLAITGGLVYLLVRERRPHEIIVLVGSGALLITLAAFAHDGTHTPAAAAARIVIDIIHLVASGVWVGALVVFRMMLATPNPTQSETQFMHDALERFSMVGTGVVIALLASGIANSGLVGPRNPLQSFNALYSQVLAGKIGLFLLMLVLATANRYWLTPKLHATLAGRSDARASIRALKLSIAFETMLALLVLGAVGWLDALPPPGAE